MKIEVRNLKRGELRASNADGKRTIFGMIPYNSCSADMGFFEMIAPGAFGQALAPGADVLCFRDHEPSLLMGRTKSGTLILEDSPQGLMFRCELPDTTQAADLAASIERGDLDGNSFGFICTEDKWTADEQGQVMRTLISVDLREISPCSMPAYVNSSVSIRTCPVELRSKIKLARRDDDMEDDSTACQCECASCVGGDCSGCTDPNCDDPNCKDGDADPDADEFDSERCRREMELELRKRRTL